MGDTVYEHQGWNDSNPWKKLLGPSGSGARIISKIPDHGGPQFPCQFETTSKGIIIVPQGFSRAYLYDGTVIIPLGYDRVPASPTGYGAEIGDAGKPTEGYSVSGSTGANIVLVDDFGFGKVGTIETGVDSAATTYVGKVLPGEYQGAVQWVDYFGNVSPISARSNSIRMHHHTTGALPVEKLLKQLYWTPIDNGPEGTIGKNLLRTKDTLNSGTNSLFIIPGNVGMGITGLFATIPDNIVRKYPDNTPDSSLVVEATDCIPVPLFKLCRLAFGRLWIGNIRGESGMIIPSLPGRYGTFGSNTEMFPDPNGGEITGLWATQGGLLAFTQTSTFLITPSDDGQSFKTSTLHPSVGCVAPASLASMPDGSAIWLGEDAFYKYNEEGISVISGEIQSTVDRINSGRELQACAAVNLKNQEYRCWVPLDGNTKNKMCLVYDGSGWKRRTGTNATSVCVTKDHRRLMLSAGVVPGQLLNNTVSRQADGVLQYRPAQDYNGVWVLDHENIAFKPASRTYTIETGWLTWVDSINRRSAKTIYLSLRETVDSSATISVYRDWRKTPSKLAYTDSTKATLLNPDDVPPLWGTTSWGVTEYWVRRRPYWKRVDIEVPSCEVYKIIISSSKPLEFIGISIDEEPKIGGFGTRIP
tara:strand:+ start:13662 stop:15590 length:1929 start_codon:yes stop_codon:yes gene_type:complete